MEHAHRVLSWQENLMSEEVPPPWMWPFEDELELWFEEVDRKRKERFGGDSEPEGEMMENEYARGRR